MVSLTADDTALLKDVGLFIEPVEIYDASGKFLGLFVPANLERGKETYARAAARLDRAEIERRKQSKGMGLPLRDGLDRLKKLEAEMERRKAAGERDFTTEEALDYFRSLRNQNAAATEPESAGGSTERPGCAIP
jgi:hypothetical protein